MARVRSHANLLEIVVDRMVVGQAFLRVCRFSLFNVILQILLTNFHVFNVVFAGRSNGRCLRTITQQRSFGHREAMNIKTVSLFRSSKG